VKPSAALISDLRPVRVVRVDAGHPKKAVASDLLSPFFPKYIHGNNTHSAAGGADQIYAGGAPSEAVAFRQAIHVIAGRAFAEDGFNTIQVWIVPQC